MLVFGDTELGLIEVEIEPSEVNRTAQGTT